MTTESLVSRLEGAVVGSRELDADIYEAMGFEVKRRAKHYGGRRFSRAWAYLRDSRWEAMGHLTTSVDAALSLAGRVLPGCCFRVQKTLPAEEGYVRKPFWATVGPSGEQETSHAATPALALCAAILKAKGTDQ